MAESALKKVCTPENYVRCTGHSDVYRALINLDGRSQVLDIEHIQIPFSANREAALLRKHPMAPGELKEYYSALADSVRSSISFVGRIQQDAAFLGSTTGSNRSAIVSYVHQEVCKREDSGVDIYLLTPTMTRYASYDRYCYKMPNTNTSEIHFSMLRSLFQRLLLTMHRSDRAGAHFGVIDLDAVCLVPGKDRNNAPMDYVTITNCLYSRYDDDTTSRMPKYLPFNAHESLLHGGRPTVMTDLYSWAALFLTILNGSYGTDFPDPSIRPDNCVPETLVNALYAALEGEISLRDMRQVMMDLNKEEKANPQSPNFNFYIIFHSEQPSYLPAPAPAAPAPKQEPKADTPAVPPAEEKQDDANDLMLIDLPEEEDGLELILPVMEGEDELLLVWEEEEELELTLPDPTEEGLEELVLVMDQPENQATPDPTERTEKRRKKAKKEKKAKPPKEKKPKPEKKPKKSRKHTPAEVVPGDEEKGNVPE